jgi:hypothetical protein
MFVVPPLLITGVLFVAINVGIGLIVAVKLPASPAHPSPLTGTITYTTVPFTVEEFVHVSGKITSEEYPVPFVELLPPGVSEPEGVIEIMLYELAGTEAPSVLSIIPRLLSLQVIGLGVLNIGLG